MASLLAGIGSGIASGFSTGGGLSGALGSLIGSTLGGDAKSDLGGSGLSIGGGAGATGVSDLIQQFLGSQQQPQQSPLPAGTPSPVSPAQYYVGNPQSYQSLFPGSMGGNGISPFSQLLQKGY